MIYIPGSYYAVGGGLESLRGYTGCVGDIQVDNRVTFSSDWYYGQTGNRLTNPHQQSLPGILLGKCSINDWCRVSSGRNYFDILFTLYEYFLGSSPCGNGGECRQLYDRAVCHCDHTGYTGAVCRTSRHWKSCNQWAAARQV